MIIIWCLVLGIVGAFAWGYLAWTNHRDYTPQSYARQTGQISEFGNNARYGLERDFSGGCEGLQIVKSDIGGNSPVEGE